MAWGPEGETVKVERPATIDEIRNERFKATYREGDELLYQSESNNHRGYARYVGRDKNGFTYAWVVYSRMS